MGDNEMYKRMIIGYSELMIRCAQDLAAHGNDKSNKDTLYYKFLQAPGENQETIRKVLKEEIPDLEIPSWAFLVFSKHQTRGTAYLSNDVVGPAPNGKQKPNDHLAAIYELNQQVQAFGTFEAGETEVEADGLHKVVSVDNVKLKDFSVLIVLPYYGVSIVEIKFGDGQEIVLSSC